MSLVIEPYKGVGNLQLGISLAQARALMGVPARQKKSKLSNEITEYWNENGIQLVFSELEGHLLEISLYANIPDVMYQGMNIFLAPSRQVFHFLCKEDGNPKVIAGVTILLNLGLSLTGFMNDDPGDDSVTVFCRGRWDEQINEMETLDIKGLL